jgi:hypothetical protein
MSASALPDDILRYWAAFAPPSGLLMLARCSRRFAAVLRGARNRCLDSLFVVAQREDCYSMPEIPNNVFEMFTLFQLSFQPSWKELRALLGEEQQTRWSGMFEYYFVEARTSYDSVGYLRTFKVFRQHGDHGRTVLGISGRMTVQADARRFEYWLQRRHGQWLAGCISWPHLRPEGRAKGA